MYNLLVSDETVTCDSGQSTLRGPRDLGADHSHRFLSFQLTVLHQILDFRRQEMKSINSPPSGCLCSIVGGSWLMSGFPPLHPRGPGQASSHASSILRVAQYWPSKGQTLALCFRKKLKLPKLAMRAWIFHLHPYLELRLFCSLLSIPVSVGFM